MRKIRPPSTGVRLLDPLWSCVVAGFTGQKVAVSVGDALAVLERVIKRDEKIEPPLDVRVVVAHFVDTLWWLMIRNNAKLCKVVFCSVCGFRIRVLESCRTSRSLGYGYGSVIELTEVPGIVVRVYRTQQLRAGTKAVVPVPRECGTGRTELIEIPGTGMNVQNSQNFRVRV